MPSVREAPLEEPHARPGAPLRRMVNPSLISDRFSQHSYVALGFLSDRIFSKEIALATMDPFAHPRRSRPLQPLVPDNNITQEI